MPWARLLTPEHSSLCTKNRALKKAQLAYYKIGEGPFYVFYTPFHLPHIQIASTIGGRSSTATRRSRPWEVGLSGGDYG